MCFGGGSKVEYVPVYQEQYKEPYVEPVVDEDDGRVTSEVSKSKRLAANQMNQEKNDQTLGMLGDAAVSSPRVYGTLA